MKFQKGNPGKPKGVKSEGSGRKPEWLKEECQKYVDDRKLIKFLADVASGEPVGEKIVINGENIEKTPCSAEVKDRLKATEMLMDRGWGKPSQQIESNSVDKFLEEFRKRFE